MSDDDLGVRAAKAAKLLETLSESGAEPDAARAAARELSRELPGGHVRVLWEQQPGAGRWHYDLLVELPDGGVLSLGYVEAGGVPFPLRAAHRSSDGDLVRVNGSTLSVGRAMTLLDFIWARRDILDQLISRMIIQEWIERLAIEVEHEEIQAAFDQLRVRRGLGSVEDTEAWLARAGLSLHKLEQLLREEVAARKLRDHVTEADVAAALADDPSIHGRTQVSWISVSAHDAERLSGIETLAELFATATELSAEGALVGCGFFADPLDLPDAIAGRLEPAEPGLRRVAMQDLVYLCHTSREPCPDPADEATIERVKDKLFAAWLDARRREAKVEWLWGR